jgi:hypothetical protein
MGQSVSDRRRRLGRQSLSTFLLSLFVLATLGAVAYGATAPVRAEHTMDVLRASGRVRISNSLTGRPIVTMTDMMPGDSTTGTVRIGNRGRVKARFSLGLNRLVETPGRDGGRLSSRLVLVVKRLQRARRPHIVYAGALRKMPLVRLGVFRPGERRRYRFTVYFPRGFTNAVDDRYQGGAVSLRFTWYARGLR